MRALLAGVVVGLAIACTSGGPTESPTPLSLASAGPSFSVISTLSPLPQPSGGTQSTPLPESEWLSPSVMDPILADASARSGVDRRQLRVLRAEAVTWPDRGLGCPPPGVEYPQVQVDGYQVIVEAGGTRYDYRGTGAGDFRLCEPAKGTGSKAVTDT